MSTDNSAPKSVAQIPPRDTCRAAQDSLHKAIAFLSIVRGNFDFNSIPQFDACASALHAGLDQSLANLVTASEFIEKLPGYNAMAALFDSADVVTCVKATLAGGNMPESSCMTGCPIRGALTVAIDKIEQIIRDISALPQGIAVPTAPQTDADASDLPGENGFALRVQNLDMVDEAGPVSFPINAIIVVDPDRAAKPGDFVVISEAGARDAFFRRLDFDGEKYSLYALNSQHAPRPLLPDAKIVGVVTHVQLPVMRVEVVSNVVGAIPAAEQSYILSEPGAFPRVEEPAAAPASQRASAA